MTIVFTGRNVRRKNQCKVLCSSCFHSFIGCNFFSNRFVILIAIVISIPVIASAQSAADDNNAADPRPSASKELSGSEAKGNSSEISGVLSPVPVRRVVMYNTGVSYIQHFGEIDGSGTMEFQFKSEDIDDVLKSMIFFDGKDGQVEAVQYQPAPTRQDIAVQEFEQPMTLAQLLQVHRGETIEARTEAAEIYRGKIWGVENRADGDFSVETVVLVVEDQWISLPIGDLQGIRFTKPEVQQHLQNALLGIAATRTMDQNRSLKILLEGNGKRRVGFAYVVDSSVWRSTYRLEVKTDHANLQAWAHVDNISGRDWENVQLDLRSGRPEVFHVELFTPWLAVRPSVSQAVFDLPPSLDLIRPYLDSLAIPETFELSNDDSAIYGNQFFGGGGGGGGGLSGQPTAYQPRLGEDTRENWQRRLLKSASATTQRASLMVQYRIDKPVRLQSGESAALPVLNEDFPIQHFTLFQLSNAEGSTTDTFNNGIRTIELENTGKFALTGGPVTVFSDGDFVGDSIVEKLEVSEKGNIGYAIDRAVSIDLSVGQVISIPKSYQWRGSSLLIGKQDRLLRFLKVDNKDTEARKIRFEIPLDEQSSWSDFKISPKCSNLGELMATYTMDVDAKSETDFSIQTTGHTQNLRSLSSFSQSQLKVILGDPELELDDQTRQNLKAYIELKNKITDLSQQETQVVQELSAVQDQIESLQRTVATLKVDYEAAAPFVKQLVEAAKRESELAERKIGATNTLEKVKQELNQLTSRN